jgi:ADP-ribose pyrophosphatase YjhB (NUDIX family)
VFSPTDRKLNEHVSQPPRHPLAAPVVNAVVLRVTDRLETLLWRRPEGTWSLPGGFVREGESLDDATRRHLASKVGVTSVGHLEQLDTRASAGTHPKLWLLDTAYVALVRPGPDDGLPPDTAWHPVAELPPIAFAHEGAVHRAHERLRGKLSYSNVAFALAPERFTLRELAALYEAVLGYAVSPTNLGRVLGRDGLLAPTGANRAAGSAGGRPAAEFAFTTDELVVSRPLAAFRPPGRPAGTGPAPAPSA